MVSVQGARGKSAILHQLAPLQLSFVSVFFYSSNFLLNILYNNRWVFVVLLDRQGVSLLDSPPSLPKTCPRPPSRDSLRL